jgi:hypothetical protein
MVRPDPHGFYSSRSIDLSLFRPLSEHFSEASFESDTLASLIDLVGRPPRLDYEGALGFSLECFAKFEMERFAQNRDDFLSLKLGELSRRGSVFLYSGHWGNFFFSGDRGGITEVDAIYLYGPSNSWPVPIIFEISFSKDRLNLKKQLKMGLVESFCGGAPYFCKIRPAFPSESCDLTSSDTDPQHKRILIPYREEIKQFARTLSD